MKVLENINIYKNAFITYKCIFYIQVPILWRIIIENIITYDIIKIVGI